MKPTTAPRATTFGEAGWGPLGLALLSHALWGSYPVMSKRLLVALPPFVLLGLGYTLIVLFMAGRLRALPWRAQLRSVGWWAIMLLVAGRMVTNILSIEATSPIYVQLVNLLTPFAVALIGRAFFGEKMPRYTLTALLLSTLGSYFVIARGPLLDVQATHWSSGDTLGVGLALLSTVCLALYMLLTRFVQTRQNTAPDTLFAQQSLVLAVVALLWSGARGESWQQLGQLTPGVWLLFGVFVVLNLAGSNLVQIRGLGRLSTTIFTSLIGVRLIVALLLGALLLGEQLTSLWELAGALLVIGTVTCYVALQSGGRGG